MTVRVDLNLSLDGIVMPANPSPENPMGEDWGTLVAAYIGTRTMRARVLRDTSGEGTTGVDERYAAAYFEGIGAEIMGAGMFGFHAFPDDPEWQGWWGDEPPFAGTVLVLTHRAHPPIDFTNSTRFEFICASPHDALAQARELAGEGDIRIGGGASVARQYLAAGLVDRLHLGITPVVLGRGTALWDDLRQLERGYDVTTEVAESGVIHVTFAR